MEIILSCSSISDVIRLAFMIRDTWRHSIGLPDNRSPQGYMTTLWWEVFSECDSYEKTMNLLVYIDAQLLHSSLAFTLSLCHLLLFQSFFVFFHLQTFMDYEIHISHSGARQSLSWPSNVSTCVAPRSGLNIWRLVIYFWYLARLVGVDILL